MSVRKAILAAASLALAVACGGGSNTNFAAGTASVTGTVGGQPVSARDAISAVVTIDSATSEALVLITNAQNQCNRLNARQATMNGQALAFTLGVQSGTTVAPPTVGTYQIFTLSAGASKIGNVAAALFGTTNPSCGTPSAPVEGNSGTVVLTNVSASGYTGTLDIIFIGGDHLTGSFTTATCAPLTNPSPNTSCVPP